MIHWPVCAQSLSHIWLFSTQWIVAARLLCSWDSPGKNTGAGCHFLLQGIFLTQGRTYVSWVSCFAGGFFTAKLLGKTHSLTCACVLSRFSHCWLCATLRTVAHEAPLSMGILQARILEWIAMRSSRGSSWCGHCLIWELVFLLPGNFSCIISLVFSWFSVVCFLGSDIGPPGLSLSFPLLSPVSISLSFRPVFQEMFPPLS